MQPFDIGAQPSRVDGLIDVHPTALFKIIGQH